ncbi:hypothetical protein [Rubripirellula obstinata]|nr:hypothetical protein [Rubripirellula obstinata]
MMEINGNENFKIAFLVYVSPHMIASNDPGEFINRPLLLRWVQLP